MVSLLQQVYTNTNDKVVITRDAEITKPSGKKKERKERTGARLFAIVPVFYNIPESNEKKN